MSNITNINGPTNIIRMEGNINGINKTLYLFFDIHEPIGKQTKCNTLLSTDINSYLADIFLKHRGEYYDFFLEIEPDDTNIHSLNKKKIYISEVRKIFRYGFKETPDLFPKIRFHYADPRVYFKILNEQLPDIESYIDKVFDAKSIYKIKFTNNDIDKLIKKVKIYLKKVLMFKKKVYSTMKDNYHHTYLYTKKELSTEQREENLNYMLKKIKTNYSNQNIKKKILFILNNEIEKIFNLWIDNINYMLEYLQNIGDIYNDNELNTERLFTKYGEEYDYYIDIVSNINKIFFKVDTYKMDVQVLLMDIYFLRRYLDKDDIKHGIYYVGAFHASNYVYFLIKYFNFKITDYAYLKGTLSNLYKTIKKTDDIYKIPKYVWRPKLIQCSNIKGFPKNLK